MAGTQSAAEGAGQGDEGRCMSIYLPDWGYPWEGATPTASPQVSTLEMSDEEKAAAAEREARRGTFGFARVLDDADRG